MPRYTYFCHSCKKAWSERHPMHFNPDKCLNCEGKVINRVPASFIQIAREALKENRKIGEVTKEYIEAAREDLEEMKGELKTTEYEPDD